MFKYVWGVSLDASCTNPYINLQCLEIKDGGHSRDACYV